jgi:hypothetical protein
MVYPLAYFLFTIFAAWVINPLHSAIENKKGPKWLKRIDYFFQHIMHDWFRNDQALKQLFSGKMPTSDQWNIDTNRSRYMDLLEEKSRDANSASSN